MAAEQGNDVHRRYFYTRLDAEQPGRQLRDMHCDKSHM